MHTKRAMIAMFGLTLMSATLQAAIPFSLKISGGAGWAVPAGSLKSWADGRDAYFRWLGSQSGNTAGLDSKSGAFKADAAFEASLALSSRWSLALGVGWIGGGDWTSNASISHVYGGDLGGDTLESNRKVTLSAVPVTLSGIYALGLGGLDLRLIAGIGLYLGRAKVETMESFSWPAAPDMAGFLYEQSADLTSSSVGFGAHVGAGVELPIGKKLRLTADVLYRIASLGEIKGDLAWKETASWSGGSAGDSGTDKDQTLWLGRFSWQGAEYDDAEFSASTPSGLTGASPLKPSLRGLVFRFGLKLAL